MKPDHEALIARACARHGGAERFARVDAITLDLVSSGGAVPIAKGQGRTFPAPTRIVVDPRRHRTVYHDYPAPGRCGVFERGRVGLFERPEATPTGPDHAEVFRGSRKLRRWGPLEALYFFGYALSHYLGLPFSLQGRTPLSARGSTLWYAFGPDDHAHSATEGFTFAADGLLVRHDYKAAFLGPMFNGAHLSADYVEVDGLWIARERRVYAKLGHRLGVRTPIPVLRARLEPVGVSFT